MCKIFDPKIRSCKFFDKSQVCIEKGNCVAFDGKDDDFDENFSCKKNRVPVAGMVAVSNMKIVPTSTSASVCQGGTTQLLLK